MASTALTILFLHRYHKTAEKGSSFRLSNRESSLHMQLGWREKDSASLLLPTVTLLYFHLVVYLFCFNESISNVLLIRKTSLLLAKNMPAIKEKILINLSTHSWDLENISCRENPLCQIYEVWASSEVLRMFLSNLVKTCSFRIYNNLESQPGLSKFF